MVPKRSVISICNKLPLRESVSTRRKKYEEETY